MIHFWLGALLLLPTFSSQADHSFVEPCNEDCYKQMGGDVPIPFTANRRVELADGEIYVLFGTIQYAPSVFTKSNNSPYFQVDLETHSWLANERRKNFPYYPLIMAGNQKLKLPAGTRVRVSARARSFVIMEKESSHRYVIGLEPLEIH